MIAQGRLKISSLETGEGDTITRFIQSCKTKKHKSELSSILSIIQLHSQGINLPGTRFNSWKTKMNGQSAQIFEYKKGTVRLYGVRSPKRGGVIVLFGFKSTQKKDINETHKIAFEILEH